jgi:hypothetical protein
MSSASNVVSTLASGRVREITRLSAGPLQEYHQVVQYNPFFVRLQSLKPTPVIERREAKRTNSASSCLDEM